MVRTRSVEFRCDLCGEPATEWARVYRHSLLDGLRQGAHDLVEVDLCPGCAARLRALLEGRGGKDETKEDPWESRPTS